MLGFSNQQMDSDSDKLESEEVCPLCCLRRSTSQLPSVPRGRYARIVGMPGRKPGFFVQAPPDKA